MTDRFLAEPATHARLGDRALLDRLGEQWRSQAAVRIDDVLIPGLLAEVASLAPQFPLAASGDPAHQELAWHGKIRLPNPAEPHYPDCLYRLVRLLRDDLPPLVESITGARHTLGDPFAIQLCGFRLGSFVDVSQATRGEVEMLLWLTAPEWPSEWGGQLEIASEAGAVLRTLPPRAGALDLVTAGRYRMSLIEREVQCLALRYELRRAEASS